MEPVFIQRGFDITIYEFRSLLSDTIVISILGNIHIVLSRLYHHSTYKFAVFKIMQLPVPNLENITLHFVCNLTSKSRKVVIIWWYSHYKLYLRRVNELRSCWGRLCREGLVLDQRSPLRPLVSLNTGTLYSVLLPPRKRLRKWSPILQSISKRKRKKLSRYESLG